MPCFKTSNPAMVIHCDDLIKLLTNLDLCNLIFLIRFYRPFDSISFHKHPSKDASNDRIWVISLFTKKKKYISMYTTLKKIYLFDITYLLISPNHSKVHCSSHPSILSCLYYMTGVTNIKSLYSMPTFLSITDPPCPLRSLYVPFSLFGTACRLFRSFTT